jgi:hypothetical protein
MAIGDTAVLNDPIAGQGSNNAARMVRHLVARIVANGNAAFDAAWMKDTFETFWNESACYTTAFTNALQPAGRAGDGGARRRLPAPAGGRRLHALLRQPAQLLAVDRRSRRSPPFRGRTGGTLCSLTPRRPLAGGAPTPCAARPSAASPPA